MRHTWEAEMATPSWLTRRAMASMVQREAGAGGVSVAVFTSRSTSSWP